MSSENLANWLNFNPLQTAFFEALLIIVLVCVFVVLAERMKLGPVIGYLLAGIVGGAAVSLSYSDHPEELLHFAEFGVVLFLFVIGLEFRPSRLWEMRGTILGRGVVQFLACSAILAIPISFYGLSWQATTVLALGLGLSSTALVMQEIDRKGERRTPYGQTAISVLLFEDLAIVPLLLVVALLAPTGADASMGETLQTIGIAIGATIALILFGRYLLEPIFHQIAKTTAPELMTAAALGIVIAAASLMIAVGLSPAMGAFIAGVMLAESSFRHEIEADVEPFRGLFLGLFFMAVGLSLDLGAVADNWLLIVLAVPFLVTVKSAMIYAVSRLFKSTHDVSMRMAFGMSQHGEFGFVLFAAAASAMLLDQQVTSVVVSIVTLSMALSSQAERLRLLVTTDAREEMEEDYSDAGGDVLIIGFGRMGQMVAQPLLDAGFDLTLLDVDASRVREARRFGSRIHFGDGTRADVLKAAGAEDARLIIVCVDDKETVGRIARMVRRKCPDATLVLRGYDRVHAVDMAQEGFTHVERETFRSGLAMSVRALELLGIARPEAQRLADAFADRDEARLARQIESATDGINDAESVKGIRPERMASDPLQRKAS